MAEMLSETLVKRVQSQKKRQAAFITRRLIAKIKRMCRAGQHSSLMRWAPWWLPSEFVPAMRVGAIDPTVLYDFLRANDLRMDVIRISDMEIRIVLQPSRVDGCPWPESQCYLFTYDHGSFVLENDAGMAAWRPFNPVEV